MCWYCRVIIATIISILFTGCVVNQQTYTPPIGKKVFQQEDKLIVEALFYSDKNISKSIKIFDNLYQKSKKPIYLKEQIIYSFSTNEYNQTLNLIDKFIKNYPKQKEEVIKYKAFIYIKKKQYQKAISLIQEILKSKRNLDLYRLMAYIYILEKKYNLAINYLKSAYSINHSEKILAEMGDLFFKHLKRPNEAISYYQTHIRLYGCSELICKRLATIYRFLYDNENLIEIYKKLYKNSGNPEYARKVVFIYLIDKKYQEAIRFVKKNQLDKNLLIFIYKKKFEDKKDYKTAYKLYKLTKVPKLFFLYSVYKFNSSKKDKKAIENVIANMENLLKMKPDNPIYLNYFGYILIKYDVDYKRGIELVKKALKISPNVPEYLDSLAWGYYKIGECKKAETIINKVDIKEKEVEYHKKMIRRCNDDFRKDNQKNRR